MVDLLGEIAAPGEDQGAALHVAVAAEVLGRRVEDDIHAELDGPLQRRGGEGAVDRGQGAGPAGELRHGPDVDDLEEGVGRALHPDQPGLRPDRGGDGAEVRHVHEVGADPPVGEEILGGHAKAIVGVVGQQDVRPRRQGLQQGDARRHAGGEDQRRLSPFERRQGVFELGLVGIRVADVGVPADRVAILAAGEGGGQVDRRRHRSRGGIDGVAGVDRQGLEFHLRSPWGRR